MALRKKQQRAYGRRTRIGGLIAATLCIIPFQNCDRHTIDSSNKIEQPSISITNLVPNITNQKNITVPYIVAVDPRNKIDHTECKLNQDRIPCSTTSASLEHLTDGDYVLKINAADNLRQNALETSHPFRIDTAKPVLKVFQTPADVSGIKNSVFVFSAIDSLSGIAEIECSVDDANFSLCISPLELKNLASGSHQIKIRAKDLAQNTSDVFTHQWTINPSTQVIAILQKPDTYTKSKSAKLEFSGYLKEESISNFQCKLDEKIFAPCTSPAQYSDLFEGVHTFIIRGQDKNGKMSSPTSISWIIDNTVPKAPVITTNINSETNLTAANFQFNSNDPSGINSYSCAWDTQTFANCVSPQTLNDLAEGKHTFKIKAVDNAGNESPVSTFNWSVDNTAPMVTITLSPAPNSTTSDASFTFVTTDALSKITSIDCQLDKLSYEKCASHASYSSLVLGSHSFRVRALDKAGNQQIATYNWTVTPPPPVTTTLTWPPATGDSFAGYMIHYGTEPGKYSHSIDAGMPTLVNGEVTYVVPNLIAGTKYYFVVTSYDNSYEEIKKIEEVAKLAL